MCRYFFEGLDLQEKRDFSAGKVSKVGAREALSKSHGSAATHEHLVQQKTMADFDKLEKQIKVGRGSKEALRGGYMACSRGLRGL